jgi:hypothetical protein
MPNKYEREIEEILRNMDRTDTKTNIGNRLRSFNRPPRPRARRSWQAPLNRTEALLLIGILLALAGAGLAYYFQSPVYLLDSGFSVSGALALAGFACIVVALVLAWRDRFRGLKTTIPPNRTWRGASDESNVVEITPRRGPLSSVATQVRLFRLKMRYRRTRGSE